MIVSIFHTFYKIKLKNDYHFYSIVKYII